MSTSLPKTGPLAISRLASLSGLIYPTYQLVLSGLAYTDANVQLKIVNTYSGNVLWHNTTSTFGGGYIITSTDSLTSINPYDVACLSTYSANATFLIDTSAKLTRPILISMFGYIDRAYSLWININNALSATKQGNLPLCIKVAEITDTLDGHHTVGGYFPVITLSSYGVKLGDKINFFGGAGPETAPTGSFYTGLGINISYYPLLTTLPYPIDFQKYGKQDFDIPISPLALSNFLSAINYDLYQPLTVLQNTSFKAQGVYYYYTPNNTINFYPGGVVALSSLSANFILKTKYSNLSGGFYVYQNCSLVAYNPMGTFINILMNKNSQVYTNPSNGTLPVCYSFAIPPLTTTTLNLSSYIGLSDFVSFYLDTNTGTGSIGNNVLNKNTLYLSAINTPLLHFIP